jgi:methylglyoxal reductase
MQTNPFPKLKTPVSRLGFGAFGLKSESIETIRSCWEQGVNFIDTARHYGESEAIIGKALKGWSGAAPFIASKAECIGPLSQWARPEPVEECFPKGHITREAETSLRTMGVECLDLYQMHLYWANWGTEGYWLDELEALKSQGKIKALGISLPDHRHDIALPLVLSGRLDSVQTVFNIFDPYPLDCLIPLCQKNEVAVLARCVLDEGGLTGSLSAESTFAEGDFRANYFDMGPRETYLKRVDALRKFVPGEAVNLAALALKYVLVHPGVTTALSSMHIREYAEENIRALGEPPLSQAAFTELRDHHRWIRNFYGGKVL